MKEYGTNIGVLRGHADLGKGNIWVNMLCDLYRMGHGKTSWKVWTCLKILAHLYLHVIRRAAFTFSCKEVLDSQLQNPVIKINLQIPYHSEVFVITTAFYSCTIQLWKVLGAGGCAEHLGGWGAAFQMVEWEWWFLSQRSINFFLPLPLPPGACMLVKHHTLKDGNDKNKHFLWLLCWQRISVLRTFCLSRKNSLVHVFLLPQCWECI